MKLSRIAATATAAAALALVGAVAHAQTQAQTPTDTSQAADQNTLTAVGGSPGPQTAMGAPNGATREQVYREMIVSQHDSDTQRVKKLYEGAGR